MSRYVIQFYKKGAMKYISHLDLLRLFKRTFKRTGIKLIYSQGFNPHPKMSFVQPLSLGYSSEKEYLDFETTESLACGEIISRLNDALPKGVGLTACRRLAPSKRTLAAIVEYGSYTASLKLENPMTSSELTEKLTDFLLRDEIIVEKKQKKTGKLVQQNIRPMIFHMALAAEEKEKEEEARAKEKVSRNNITLTLLICAGSNRNLNPEVLLKAFCESSGIPFHSEETEFTRNELFCQKAGAKAGTIEIASAADEDSGQAAMISIFDCEPAEDAAEVQIKA